jgi:hypothetical protein
MPDVVCGESSFGDLEDLEASFASTPSSSPSFASISAFLAASASVTTAAARAASSTEGSSSSKASGFSAARCISSLMRAITAVRDTPSIGSPATLTTLLPTTTP